MLICNSEQAPLKSVPRCLMRKGFSGAAGMKTEVPNFILLGTIRVTGGFTCGDASLFLFIFLLSSEKAHFFFFFLVNYY